MTNLPTGVSKGTVTRISATKVNIALTGNRTADYDSNITNLQVSVANTQIDGYTGTALGDNTGVMFTASNPVMTISAPTNQAARANPLLGEKIIAFKATSTVDSIIDFSIARVGGYKANFSDVKIYIDLNDDGNADANEQVTADGVGGTINNGTALTISYSDQGIASEKANISGLKLTTTQMAHDIMAVGNTDERIQPGVGQTYRLSSKKAVDLIEDITVSGDVVIP